MNKESLKKLKKYIYPAGIYKNTRSNSRLIRKYFPTIYESIKSNYGTNLFMLLNNIKDIPVCKNTTCDNRVKLKNIGAGFRLFCSNKCIGQHQKTDIEFSNKIKNKKKERDLKNIKKKFPSLSIIPSEIDHNYYRIQNYCKHSPFDIHRGTFENLLKKQENLCLICKKEKYETYMLSSKEILEFQNEFESFYSKNKYSFKENWFEIYYPKEYAILNHWSIKYKEVSLPEKIYMFRHRINTRPMCSICNKRELKFKSAYEGYSKTCNNYSCLKNTSTKEIDLLNFLKDHTDDVQSKFFIERKEFDILIPERKILVEFNGLYWHGDLIQKDNKYHYKKYILAKNHGYKLFNIWEDDWENKRDIIKSMLLNKIGISSFIIYGRKCEIKEIKSTKKFLDENHLQGWCQSSINIGLFYNNNMVSIMTFGKRNIYKNSNKYEYELLRFCNEKNTRVIGGASKLFKYFQNNYSSDIISFASCDYSDGNLYEKLGFKFKEHTNINYWWCDNNIKYHRSKFMKYKLIDEGYDKNKTADEIMRERGYYKIWGTGNLLYNFKGK